MIKGGKTSAVFPREGEEVVVGEMFVRGKLRERMRIRQGQIVRPKLMAGCGEEVLQELSCQGARPGTIAVAWISDDADESILNQRARRPPHFVGQRNEANGCRMVRVISIRQGNQDIGVQKMDHAEASPMAFCSSDSSNSSSSF